MPSRFDELREAVVASLAPLPQPDLLHTPEFVTAAYVRKIKRQCRIARREQGASRDETANVVSTTKPSENANLEELPVYVELQRLLDAFKTESKTALPSNVSADLQNSSQSQPATYRNDELELKEANRLVADALTKLLILPHTTVKPFCSALPWSNLSSTQLIDTFAQVLEPENIALQNAIHLIQCGLLPHVRNLSATPSRYFVAGVLNIARTKPQSVINGLILPLMENHSIGSSQADLANRIIKESLSEADTTFLFCQLFKHQNRTTTASLPSTSATQQSLQPWSDSFITTFKTILSIIKLSPPHLDEEETINVTNMFLLQLDRQITLFPKSTPLAGLLLLLVQKNPKAAKSCAANAMSVAGKSATFLRKTIERSLDKLK